MEKILTQNAWNLFDWDKFGKQPVQDGSINDSFFCLKSPISSDTCRRREIPSQNLPYS